MRLRRETQGKRWYADHLIEFKELPQKGVGVIAKANIPRGTRVISEQALLEVDLETVTLKNIVSASERLLPSQQESYLQLHGYDSDLLKVAVKYDIGKSWQELPELHRKVLSIYAANAFGCVFFLGSHINHSCIPNATLAYNESLKEEAFDVIRDIMAGEELTVMYIDGINRTQSQRQAELDKWGFQCTCPACEDTAQGRQRDKKRAELFILDQKLAKAHFHTEGSCRRGLQIVQRMAAIQKSEGLVNRQLRISYYDAARYCLELKEHRMALLWAEKVEVDLYCVGEDYPEYKKVLLIVEEMRNAVHGSKPLSESSLEWFMRG